MGNLRDYAKVIGKERMQHIYERAEPLKDKHILCINSTSHGGGVAEILNSVVFMFNSLDIDFGWRTLHGTSDFFSVTKQIHNSLQGEDIMLTKKKKKQYYDTNRRFSVFTHIDHDMVIVHDPQPLPLIDFYRKRQPWIFRLHMDLSNPNMTTWRYLKPFIEKYDHLVVSKEDYKKKLDVGQSVIYPAIDPLSQKNRRVPKTVISKHLKEHGIDRSKPMITQISRFDKWKDPLGVLKIFEKVREKQDCQLVLVGSFSVDDPEGQRIYEKVERTAGRSRYRNDIKLILDTTDLMVNILQRESAVVVQKSLKEGFGLVVSEALYKGTPVVASNVGGIPFQVLDGINGFLREPTDFDGFAGCILRILRDDNLREDLGMRGEEHIRNNFLVTRLLVDWLDLMEGVFRKSKYR